MAARISDTIKRGRLTDEELADISKFGERGWSPGRIAGRLNRHPGTVNYAMHRLGVRTLTRRSFSYVRRGKLVKSFSPEEDAFVIALRVQGYSVCKIADLVSKRFGHERSAHTVNVRLVLLSNDEAA